jgi:heptosyltransferase-1
MSNAAKNETVRILVVRLGAMGDILHTLPAAATLKTSFPGSRLTWIVESKWASLLEGNPFVDRVVLLRRGSARTLLESWRELRAERYDFGVDFQGLLKSAVTASAARPERIFGFETAMLRERAAGVFYSRRVFTDAVHVVDKNLALATAAGGVRVSKVFSVPEGHAEGELPAGKFILASPLAGWRSKQWPVEHYRALAASLQKEMGLPLVANLPPGAEWPREAGISHLSGLSGLIYATRRAAAVIGVDSGPMHLAAALGKPGVAIFGPTDPVRNGPYGGTLRVLRWQGAETTYKRGTEIDESMKRISADEVFETLRTVLNMPRRPAGCCN